MNEVKSAQMYCEIELGQLLGPNPGRGDFHGNQHAGVPHADNHEIPPQRAQEFRRFHGWRDALVEAVRNGARNCSHQPWPATVANKVGAMAEQQEDGKIPSRMDIKFKFKNALIHRAHSLDFWIYLATPGYTWLRFRAGTGYGSALWAFRRVAEPLQRCNGLVRGHLKENDMTIIPLNDARGRVRLDVCPLCLEVGATRLLHNGTVRCGDCGYEGEPWREYLSDMCHEDRLAAIGVEWEDAHYHVIAVQDWGGSQQLIRWWNDEWTRDEAEAHVRKMIRADSANGPEREAVMREFGDQYDELASTNVCPGWEAIWLVPCYSRSHPSGEQAWSDWVDVSMKEKPWWPERQAVAAGGGSDEFPF